MQAGYISADVNVTDHMSVANVTAVLFRNTGWFKKSKRPNVCYISVKYCPIFKILSLTRKVNLHYKTPTHLVFVATLPREMLSSAFEYRNLQVDVLTHLFCGCLFNDHHIF